MLWRQFTEGSGWAACSQLQDLKTGWVKSRSKTKRAEVEGKTHGTEATQYLHQDLETKRVDRPMGIRPMAMRAIQEGETELH